MRTLPETIFERKLRLHFYRQGFRFAEHLVGTTGMPDMTCVLPNGDALFVECKFVDEIAWRGLPCKRVFQASQWVFALNATVPIAVYLEEPRGVWSAMFTRDIAMMAPTGRLDLFDWHEVLL